MSGPAMEITKSGAVDHPLLDEDRGVDAVRRCTADRGRDEALEGALPDGLLEHGAGEQGAGERVRLRTDGGGQVE